MIARLQVNRWEHPCFGQLIKQVLSTRKWVSVADRNCIECSVVNDYAEGAIFFGKKQDGRTKRRCRWSDPFLLHQNRDLALGFFQFLWTEPVDRLERESCTRFKWDGVTSSSVRRQTSWDIAEDILIIIEISRSSISWMRFLVVGLTCLDWGWVQGWFRGMELWADPKQCNISTCINASIGFCCT